MCSDQLVMNHTIIAITSKIILLYIVYYYWIECNTQQLALLDECSHWNDLCFQEAAMQRSPVIESDLASKALPDKYKRMLP